MNGNKLDVKIVLLGDSGAGKSSILVRYVANNFSEVEEANIGASYMGKNIRVGEKLIKLNIWDTAGQERFQNLAKIYYRDATAALLVYDITSRRSFEGMKRWYRELEENGPKDIVKVIAANKEDLIKKESVSLEEAVAFANKIGAHYRRTSAKTGIGIELLFRDIVSTLYPDMKNDMNSKKPNTVYLSRTYSVIKSKKKCCF